MYSAEHLLIAEMLRNVIFVSLYRGCTVINNGSVASRERIAPRQ